MSIVLGLWHLVVEGGKDQTIQTPACVQITNISYGEEIVDTNSRDVVKLSFESLGDDKDDDDEEEEEDNEDKDSNDGLRIDTTVLCALTPGKIEHALVNITLDSDAMYKFEVVGKNTVYLTGNYIRQDEDEDVSGSEDEFDSEDGYDLREVSSDVEMHADDLDELESNNSRFEEVVDTPEPAKGKRARESDVSEAPVKAEKKNKKQKAESGKVVEVPAEEKKDKKKEKKEKETKAATEKPEPKAKRTIAGGVVIQDAKIGSGPVAKAGNTVRMRYVGKLTNGKEFDKNVSGKPFVFRLGKGEVIKGWDEGIAGMQVGGERVLTIPPAMAYGSKKTGSIPANSTLIFEVKLLEIK